VTDIGRDQIRRYRQKKDEEGLVGGRGVKGERAHLTRKGSFLTEWFSKRWGEAKASPPSKHWSG